MATTTAPDIDGDIRDANLGLLASTARLLEEAERVRRHHDRLMDLIRQRPIDRKAKPKVRTDA
jgi:hypothetical protein